MKKYTPYIFILMILVGLFSPAFQAQATVGSPPPCGTGEKEDNINDGLGSVVCILDTDPGFNPTTPPSSTQIPCKTGYTRVNNTCVVNGTYTLLQPLGVDKTFNPQETGALGKYISIVINLVIGLSAILAVIMIVLGGMQYMTSELISSKEAGKERIKGALLGLLIALGAFALLNTINSSLLNGDIALPPAYAIVSDKDIIISNHGQVSAGDGSSINQKSIGTTCDSRTILAAAQSAGQSLTEGQAATFACLITPESGCQSLANYNWGGGSSAYGPYQILLQTHSDCFDNQTCSAAAGVSGPLRCSTGFYNGNPISGSAVAQQCKQAADNFTCSTVAAACVLKKQGFSAWTADSRNAKQRACITKYNH